jgi:hypothetical protein
VDLQERIAVVREPLDPLKPVLGAVGKLNLVVGHGSDKSESFFAILIVVTERVDRALGGVALMFVWPFYELHRRPLQGRTDLAKRGDRIGRPGGPIDV